MKLYIEINTSVARMNKEGSLPFAMPDIDMKKDGQTCLSAGSGEACMKHAYEWYEIKPKDIEWGPKITARFGKRSIGFAVKRVQRLIDEGEIKYETPEARKERWQKERLEQEAKRKARLAERNKVV